MSLSRFKACLVGAVIGDCVGAVFEGRPVVKLNDVLEYVARIERYRETQRKDGSRPANKYGLQFTDDTAMVRSVATSLLEKKQFDAWDMGQRFSKSYFDEPDRGYGGNVVTVFEGLGNPELKDVFKPASEQFNGTGSYGNGGAMRVSPVALFTFKDNDVSKLESLASSVTRLTHTHQHAINGAILQALAVDQCLRLTQREVNVDEFVDSLISKMKPIEEKSSDTDRDRSSPPPKKVQPKRKLDAHPTPYCAKLEKIKEFLKCEKLTVDDVVNVLGNDVSALGSVPAAVLSFLRAATQTIPQLEGKNKFEQTVLYAISLGGDTDTVATMAAAMAGALYGMEEIPEPWQYYSEGVAEAEDFAERLYRLSQSQSGAGSEERHAAGHTDDTTRHQ